MKRSQNLPLFLLFLPLIGLPFKSSIMNVNNIVLGLNALAYAQVKLREAIKSEISCHCLKRNYYDIHF